MSGEYDHLEVVTQEDLLGAEVERAGAIGEKGYVPIEMPVEALISAAAFRGYQAFEWPAEFHKGTHLLISPNANKEDRDWSYRFRGGVCLEITVKEDRRTALLSVNNVEIFKRMMYEDQK